MDAPFKILALEGALKSVAERIAAPEFCEFVRSALEAGDEPRYELTIEKSNNRGIVVLLNYFPAPRKTKVWRLIDLS